MSRAVSFCGNRLLLMYDLMRCELERKEVDVVKLLAVCVMNCECVEQGR
jgi:hypothetical protein